ncbi:MAG: hypothetical protein EOO83_04840, partial [Oxalobacteraceae bacterium]
YLGGEAAQLSIGISDKVSRVFQGLLLFFVLSCDDERRCGSDDGEKDRLEHQPFASAWLPAKISRMR